MVQQNASKFAIFLEYKNPWSIFHFVLLYFSPNECPGVCRNRLGKNKVAPNEKRKNYVGFQFSYSKSMTNFEVFR